MVKTQNTYSRSGQAPFSKSKSKFLLILAVFLTVQMVLGTSDDFDTNPRCMSRLRSEHDEKNKVFLDSSISNGAMAWTWNIAPDKSISTLQSTMMPDLTPEFSVDGL